MHIGTYDNFRKNGVDSDGGENAGSDVDLVYSSNECDPSLERYTCIIPLLIAQHDIDTRNQLSENKVDKNDDGDKDGGVLARNTVFAHVKNSKKNVVDTIQMNR